MKGFVAGPPGGRLNFSRVSASAKKVLKIPIWLRNFQLLFTSGTNPTREDLMSNAARNTPQHAVTLSWATFSEAADQAGISRRYGGIHFELGDLAGRACGRRVAKQAWKKAQSLFHGAGAQMMTITTSRIVKRQVCVDKTAAFAVQILPKIEDFRVDLILRE